MSRPLDSDAPLMLSVSGARGLVGRTMTPPIAVDLAAAFATHVKRIRGVRPVICLGRDSRPSGSILAGSTAAALAAVGARVVDLGVVATPTVGVMIRRLEADGGIVVTASHNPIEWNGVKFLMAGGVAPPAEDAAVILEAFRAGVADYAGVDDLGVVAADPDGTRQHVEDVLPHVNVEAIRAAGLNVVLDSVNGAGGAGGRMLLEMLGVDVAHDNAAPTGRFAHPPEPVEAHLGDLADHTRRIGAAAGFAQDPDADRLAIVDERGRYIGEEYTLVLAARRWLDQHGGPGVVAANLSTSRMIDDLATRYPGVRVVRTAVGEANVAAALRAAGADARIGGEGNGGVILPAVTWVRDSLSSMALVLDLLAAEGRPLSALVDELPAYVMLKRKVDLSMIGGRAAIAPALDAIAHHFADATQDRADGIRVDTSGGWVHVRPSNTEPIMRLIAEGSSKAAATDLLDEAVDAAGLAGAVG
ncbi:MAG: phosphoglucosamine mutase [Phycisphaerales bacterium]|nr:phosphoglucosamine mutase [Phycisphaerales bacterium]